MKHNMQEMSANELETTFGGVAPTTWEQIGAMIGQGIDSFIAAAKAIGVGLKELFMEFKALFG